MCVEAFFASEEVVVVDGGVATAVAAEMLIPASVPEEDVGVDLVDRLAILGCGV